MEELGAGEVVGGMVDVCSETKEPSRVPFKPEQINKLLGTDLTSEEMLGYLARVELSYDPETNEIVAPTFRQDINCEADVAEEVARFFGYDKIPTTLPTGEATTGKMPFKLRIEQVARDIAEYCGFSEGMTYSFESPKVFDKLRLPKDSDLRNAITLSNPLGEDYSIMRTTTLNGMLSSLATNYNRRNKGVRLYEMGNVYLPKSLPLEELPDERMQFTLGMYGSGDFFDMKGVCEEFFEKIGMKEKMHYSPESEKTYLHPGRQANMLYKGTVVGYLGEVHPLVADAYNIGEKTYIAVIDIPTVLEFASFNHKYTGIAKYPAVTRDLSMVVPKAVLAGDIERMLEQRGGKILESYQLFDVYEGSQIKEGYKSMAYSIVFRAHDKTLEENEITAAMKKILNGLTSLGIELRS
jgi:phenylalanyl-tRNA synthetase beta chain